MATPNKRFFILSILLHVVCFLFLIVGLDFSAPLVVVENTNQSDIISAVVLGDTQKSKIITPSTQPPPILENKPQPLSKPREQTPLKKDVIALKIPKKIPKKMLPNDLFGKDLLADLDKLKKNTAKQKKKQQQQLQKQFEKTLHQQAEKSMRQQLLKEEIKIKSTESHLSQGIINKYQALIQQAISEHWVIPPQSNKKLYSLLLIRLAPGGIVLEVQITRSSGDTALDNSARAAVYKASPLPVPSDPASFEPFRQFNLKAKPENILNNDGGLSG